MVERGAARILKMIGRSRDDGDGVIGRSDRGNLRRPTASRNTKTHPKSGMRPFSFSTQTTSLIAAGTGVP